MNFNKVIISGHLGADPDIKAGKDDSAFGSLSVGTNSFSKDKDGNKVTQTEWTRVAVYGQNADFSALLTKGQPVLVEGRLRTRKYTDKAGAEKFVTEVVASNVQSIKPKA